MIYEISIDEKDSTSGYVFHIGSGVILWESKKHPIVMISSAKAKYVAATKQLVKHFGYVEYWVIFYKDKKDQLQCILTTNQQ
jgi:hypothetical protein